MEIARLYLDAQQSFLALVEPLGGDGWARRVPCTPEWTVRDVLSHLAGVCDDVANGRVEGAGTEPWTQAQVERWRDTDAPTLIAQWREQGPHVADILERFHQIRPPFDVHTHEHDVRHVFGLPGNRTSELIATMAAGFASGEFEQPLAIEFDDGTSATIGDCSNGATRLSDMSQFEFVRSRLGRRTRDQVASYTWSQPPSEATLDEWFLFGPAQHEIRE